MQDVCSDSGPLSPQDNESVDDGPEQIEETGRDDLQNIFHIPTPTCDGLAELPAAAEERAELNKILGPDPLSMDDIPRLRPIERYIARGLALTTGSAIEETPPSDEECLNAFLVTNSHGLTVGARAWTKHAPRPQNSALTIQ